MTAESYEDYLKGIKDTVVSIVDGTTSFNGKVSADIIHSEDENPSARVELRDDAVLLEESGFSFLQHRTTLVIKVRYLAGVAESDFDTLLGYVGEIVDAVDSYRLNPTNPSINRIEVMGTEYSAQIRDPGAPLSMLHCHITVRVDGYRKTE